MPIRILVLILIAILVTPVFSHAQVRGDYDQDGVSDIALLDINDDGSLAWNVYSVGTASLISASSSFGEVGDHIIYGNWLSSASAAPAILDSGRKNVTWTLLGDSENTSIQFGRIDDYLFGGADFDNDGISDAAFARLNTEKNFSWSIKTGFFTETPTDLDPIVFGRDGDILLYFDPDGAGDQLAFLRRDTNARTYTLYLKDPQSLTETTVALGAIYIDMRALPLRSSAGPDMLVLIWQDNAQTKISFRNSAGAEITEKTLSAKGEVLVGDFSLAYAGEEIALQTSTGFTIYNPEANQSILITTPTGIAVDTVNINTFDVALHEGVDVPGPCLVNTMLPDQVLYKESNLHGGRGPTLILSFFYRAANNGFPRQRGENYLIYDRHGALIGSFGNYAIDSPFGSRNYTGVSGGSFDSARSLYRDALRAGSSNIYIDVSPNQNSKKPSRNQKTCWLVHDPRSREGGVTAR